MQWHIFTEDRRRSPAPSFRLPSSQGKPFSPDDQRGWGNLVLFFGHDRTCSRCQAALQEFAARRIEYGAVEAKIVPVLPNTGAQVAALTYPFPVLADPDGAVRARYGELVGVESFGSRSSHDPVMFFVLDRYGAPYAATVLDEPDDPELQLGLLEWLDFIEIQCPE